MAPAIAAPASVSRAACTRSSPTGSRTRRQPAPSVGLEHGQEPAQSGSQRQADDCRDTPEHERLDEELHDDAAAAGAGRFAPESRFARRSAGEDEQATLAPTSSTNISTKTLNAAAPNASSSIDFVETA